MAIELLAAFVIVATGTAFSGASTYLYQWLSRQEAQLQYGGENVLGAIGNLLLSFVCGPFIMLGLGWRRDSAGGLHLGQAFLSAFIAFGWSFFVGLIVLWFYMGVMGI